MNYYRSTFTILGIFSAIAFVMLIATTSWRKDLENTFRASLQEAKQLERSKAAAEEKLDARIAETKALRNFAKAWAPFRQPASNKDLGNHLRNALATLATRTGLTSEGASVPAEPRTYAVGGSTIKVQQISVNVISESLPALLTWLGEVESQFAYARIESLTLSSYASHSVQLGVTLFHPLDEESRASSEKIAASEVMGK